MSVRTPLRFSWLQGSTVKFVKKTTLTRIGPWPVIFCGSWWWPIYGPLLSGDQAKPISQEITVACKGVRHSFSCCILPILPVFISYNRRQRTRQFEDHNARGGDPTNAWELSIQRLNNYSCWISIIGPSARNLNSKVFRSESFIKTRELTHFAWYFFFSFVQCKWVVSKISCPLTVFGQHTNKSKVTI